MPSPLLQLRIPQDLADWLEAKYPSRGEVAEYVRQLLTAEQMKEAVASLVPEGFPTGVAHSPSVWTAETEEAMKAHWSKQKLTDEEWKALNEWQAKGLPSDLQDEEGSPLPKPKARRKRFVMPVSPGAAESELKPVTVPARCNRGACTGTIKPNGRCIRCNQEPLKESK